MKTSKILITGAPGIGKTTIIKKIIDNLQKKGCAVDGFYTQEIREQGKRTGFKIIGLRNFEGMLAHVNFKTKHRVGKYFVKVDDLEECIDNIANPEVLIIDEIGKMELFSEKFKRFIEKILDEDRIVIATVGEKFVRRFGKNTELIRVTLNNRDSIPEIVLNKL